MTSAELVTLPEQVVKESIPAHKAPLVKEPSAVISPVKSSLVGKQTASAPDSYKDADMVCQKIPYNQKVEQDLRRELSSCTKGDDGKINKALDIQIPELSLEAILTGSSEITAQNIVDLFRVAMKLRRKEILYWYCYYKARVGDIKSKNGVDEEHWCTAKSNPFFPTLLM